MNKPDIRPDHFKIVQDILNKSLSSDVKVWVYGSRAKWTTLDSSDLDLALEGKDKIDYEVMNRLGRDFEESNLPYEVDVVDMATVQFFFKNIINKDKVLLDRYASIKEKKTVPKGWREVKLGDVIFVNPSEVFPKDNTRKKVLMDDLTPFRKKISNYTNDIYKGGSRFRNGDTLLARITPCLENGKTAFVDVLEKDEVGFGSTEFIVMRSKSHLTDKHFLFYLAISPYFRNLAIKSMTGSSGRQRVQTDEIMNIEVFLPPLSEQKAIAEILSSLDDKIEQNQNMNKILEDIAQAIFKSWFIDFDPVHAKKMALEAGLSEGQAERAAMAVIAGVCSPKQFAENFRQMDRSLGEKFSKINQSAKYELIYKASLFPSEFVESKLGPIPKGWNESNIGNEFNITMGQSPKGDTYNTSGEGVLFFQGRKDFDFRFPKERIFTSAPNRMAKAGDTLISVRAPVGDRNMAIKDCCVGRGLASLRHKSNNTTYTYYLISYIEKSLDGLGGSGTVFNSITKDTLSNIKIVAPSSSVIDKYNDMIKSFDDQIISLSIEINHLSNLRDALLPKLLSGEIAVSKIKTRNPL